MPVECDRPEGDQSEVEQIGRLEAREAAERWLRSEGAGAAERWLRANGSERMNPLRTKKSGTPRLPKPMTRTGKLCGTVNA